MSVRSTPEFFDGTNNPLILDAVSGTGAGNTIKAEGYNTILIQVIADDTAVGTIQFKGTSQLGTVDFGSAASISNPYALIGFYDMNTGSFTSGSTGLVVAADEVFELELNVDELNTFTADVTAYTSGEFTVTATLKNSAVN